VIAAKVRVAWIRKVEPLIGKGGNKYKVGLEFINLENNFKNFIVRSLANAS
jgi:hypothetical protein